MTGTTVQLNNGMLYTVKHYFKQLNRIISKKLKNKYLIDHQPTNHHGHAHWRDVPEGHYFPVMQQKQKFAPARLLTTGGEPESSTVAPHGE